MNARGVFSKADLQSAVRANRIIPCPGFQDSHIGSASVDIGISSGEELYRVERIAQPNPRYGETVRSMLPWFGAKRMSFGDTLNPHEMCLAKATLNANFPPEEYAFANAKSTSGRMFVQARTLADNIFMFDSVDQRRQGYSGEIWLILSPIEFPMIITDKECYSQLRVFDGDTRFSEHDLNCLLQTTDLLFRQDGTPYPQGDLSFFSHDGSIFLTVAAKERNIGFVARQGVKKPIDFSARGLDYEEYFEPIHPSKMTYNDEESWGIALQPGRCYLLSTNEMFKVPDDHCSELVALDPRFGHVFSHFAGFFDPGFFGTATLEVYSALPAPVFLRHKQPFAKFVLEKLRSPTVPYANNYQGQIGTKLPKQFKQ